jgi:predicted MPP superfamily phosphohydrolase
LEYLPLIVFALLWLLLERVAFVGMRTAFPSGWKHRVVLGVWGFGVACVLLLVVAAFIMGSPPVNATPPQNLVAGLAFTFLIVKFIFAVVYTTGEGIRLLLRWRRWHAEGRRSHADPQQTDHGQPAQASSADHSRRRFVGRLALGVAAFPFAAFLHGVVRGRYQYRVRRIRIAFPDLPPAFDGLVLVQLSDFHAGSFDDPEAVKAGLELVQAEDPDLVLFSGDLVNDRAEEVEPYKDVLGKLKGRLGKFASLGNHDYGGYSPATEGEGKIRNLNKLKAHHADMGFRLLNNEHVRLERNDQSIVLAGVENWGHRPFPQLGDLDKALAGTAEDDFVVLLSHDPTHWDEKVRPNGRNVHLTLSGHTHGAQMGVEVPPLRFSPSQFVYPRWAGLYTEGAEHLYVNRGFGYIGFPGRVGIWPEVARIELVRGTA